MKDVEDMAVTKTFSITVIRLRKLEQMAVAEAAVKGDKVNVARTLGQAVDELYERFIAQPPAPK